MSYPRDGQYVIVVETVFPDNRPIWTEYSFTNLTTLKLELRLLEQRIASETGPGKRRIAQVGRLLTTVFPLSPQERAAHINPEIEQAWLTERVTDTLSQ